MFSHLRAPRRPDHGSSIVEQIDPFIGAHAVSLLMRPDVATRARSLLRVRAAHSLELTPG
ncbi:hypothetical protein GCM10008957_40820 [Deinococcus ruber]|uniref:Uncharacterized protein n=1 Tax=Deinococcus ruber TaxID=1848197 RepID=A0A918CHS0_9DEIO|nr:hypothetical protein GCM10008957_40820 [Deinococcus ruber]